MSDQYYTDTLSVVNLALSSTPDQAWTPQRGLRDGRRSRAIMLRSRFPFADGSHVYNWANLGQAKRKSLLMTFYIGNID
jgi:hypothetical protein